MVHYIPQADFNSNMTSGNFDLVFSETWGAPYDPHSYLASWTTPDEAHYPVMQTMSAPLNPTSFAAAVDEIMIETDSAERQKQYADLLGAVHAEAFHLPLYSKQIPSVTSRARLAGYAPGYQQFDYPIHKARVASGSKNVTVAPGAQRGLFNSVGRLDPHSYRPNEFFSNNWVYEGLLAYGANGQIEPALASSWTVSVAATGIETIRFTLREGVTFHDGAAFTCAVVKLNFDHVFVPNLRTADWHGWYGLPGALDSWSCDGETFVLVASKPYYPLLQELTYIRPLRMLSPDAFADGITTSPVTKNSCPAGWGTVDGTDDYPAVECVGTLYPSGTGPFKFESREKIAPNNVDNSTDARVVFAANENYWNGVRGTHY